MTLKTVALAASASAIALSASGAFAGETLDAIMDAGVLQCGVNTGLAGFASPDSEGNYVGFDVDLCKAIAVALFNDPDAVEYTPLTSQQRFTALQSGEVDVLIRNTTWTLSRDTSLGLNFAGINFYDGQG